MVGVNVAVCGMKYIDLESNTIKILGTFFSYSEILRNQKYFNIINDKENALNLWRMKNSYT